MGWSLHPKRRMPLIECLAIYLRIYLLIYLRIHLRIYLRICLQICLRSISGSVCGAVCRSICGAIWGSICGSACLRVVRDVQGEEHEPPVEHHVVQQRVPRGCDRDEHPSD
jgi:hypothetical protein